MEYIYFVGDYKKYYEELKDQDLAGKTEKFHFEFKKLFDEISTVNYIVNMWHGEAASTIKEENVVQIIEEFEKIREKIDEGLVPATDAMINLVPKLEILKNLEDEKISKEKNIKNKLEKNISKAISTKDSNGTEIYKENPEYTKREEEISIIKKEIEELIKKLEIVKEECDVLIQKIKNLEESLEDFSQYSNKMLGNDDTDFDRETLSQRLETIDKILNNYKNISSFLLETLKLKYGDDVNDLSVLLNDFKDVDYIFDVFDIYNQAGVKKENLFKTVDGNSILKLDEFTKILNFCYKNDILNKIKDYSMGKSWETSGLSSIYKGFSEKDLNNRIKYKDISIIDVREHLLDKLDVFVKSFSSIMNDYNEYRSLLEAKNFVDNKIYQLNRGKELLPYEIYLDDPKFKEYFNKDFANYKNIDRNILKYLDIKEVALYDFLLNNKSKSEAEKYLKLLDDAINQRVGHEKASEYVEWLLKDGFQAQDLVNSGFEGFKDGVRGWWDGVLDLFRVESTEAGTKTAFDYELLYKAELLYETALKYNVTEEQCAGINQFYQTGSSVGNMMVPVLSSFVPVVGKGLSSGLMFLSITGNSAVEAKQGGATTAQAYIYGGLTGASETITERFMGGIPGVSNLGKSFIGNMVSEGIEEFSQTYIDKGLRNLVLGESNDLLSAETFYEAVESGKQGMITSGILQGGTSSTTGILNKGVYIATGKKTTFTTFKNTTESNYYTAKAKGLFDGVIAKNGEVSQSEANVIGNTVEKLSPAEISRLTENMTSEQVGMIEDVVGKSSSAKISNVAEKTHLSFLVEGKDVNTKMEMAKVVKEIDSGNIKIDYSKNQLNTEVTREGKTLKDYLGVKLNQHVQQSQQVRTEHVQEQVQQSQQLRTEQIQEQVQQSQQLRTEQVQEQVQQSQQVRTEHVQEQVQQSQQVRTEQVQDLVQQSQQVRTEQVQEQVQHSQQVRTEQVQEQVQHSQQVRTEQFQRQDSALIGSNQRDSYTTNVETRVESEVALAAGVGLTALTPNIFSAISQKQTQQQNQQQNQHQNEKNYQNTSQLVQGTVANEEVSIQQNFQNNNNPLNPKNLVRGMSNIIVGAPAPFNGSLNRVSNSSIVNTNNFIIEDIRYCISTMMAKYNADYNAVFNEMKKLVRERNYARMTRTGDARSILQQYSFSEIENALNMITKKIDVLVEDSFFNTQEKITGGYGVNQGMFFDMMTFIIDGKPHTYRESLALFERDVKNGKVLNKGKIIKSCGEAYFDSKKFLSKRFGFTDNEASKVITCVDSTGACSYTSLCNEIFESYDGKEKEFKRDFGFDMYKEILNDNGKIIRSLNESELLLDMYVFINAKENGGKMFDGTSGNYSIDRNVFNKAKYDPLGRAIIDSSLQSYMDRNNNKKNVIKYFKSKNISVDVDNLVYFQKMDVNNFDSIISKVKEGLKNGEKFSLGIYDVDPKKNPFYSKKEKNIRMISSDISRFNHSATSAFNGNAHSVYVTGIKDSSFIVSSWGRKYYIPFSDLIENQAWALSRIKIDVKTNMSSSSIEKQYIPNYFKVLNDNFRYGISKTELDDMIFFVHDNKKYTYEEALIIYNSARVRGTVISSFTKHGNIDYSNTINNLRVRYGFNNQDASKVISGMLSSQTEQYSNLANQIFKVFDGNSTGFKDKFGFDMYVKDNSGNLKLNTTDLLVDIFVSSNSTLNGGQIFNVNNGVYSISPSAMSTQLLDPLGRPIIDNAKEISSFLNPKLDIFAGYLKSKGINYQKSFVSNVGVTPQSIDNSYINSIFGKVLNGMNSNKIYSIDLSNSFNSIPITVLNSDGSQKIMHYSGVNDLSKVFITDLSDVGLYFSYLGKKHCIKYKDLINKSNWTIEEVSFHI